MSWETSAEFDRLITRHHTRIVRLEVLRHGSTEAFVPAPLGGEVVVDASQSVRRRCDVPLVDATGDLVPGASQDLLYPNGDELRVWRGIDFEDDRPGHPADVAPLGCELVPAFTGPLFQNDIDHQTKGAAMGLDCYGRERMIQRARWPRPYLIAAGTKWVDVIRRAIIDRMPAAIPLDFSGFMDDSLTVAADFAVGGDAQGDPWANITKWARILGAEVFFDGFGNPILREVPSLNTDPLTRTYRPGQDAGLLGVKKRITIENTYNVVVARAEGSALDHPIQRIARDDDPDSATYTGTIGEVTKWFQTPLLTTGPQVLKAARSILNKRLGGVVTMQYTSMVNPAREAGDIERVVDDETRTDLHCILDAFPVPLDVDSTATGVARQRGGGG